MIEGLRQPLDQLANRISGNIGVRPIMPDGFPYVRLWSVPIQTSSGPVRAGARLAISPEHFRKNVLGFRVFGEIVLDHGLRWSRLYLGEPLDLAQIRDGFPMDLDRRLLQAVQRAWHDTHEVELLETIPMRLREQYDFDSFN